MMTRTPKPFAPGFYGKQKNSKAELKIGEKEECLENLMLE